MPQQRQSIRVPMPLPLKGVNRNFARGLQPAGTCWDAKNVLPFDRQGRLRIAQRAGAGKLEELDGTSKIRMLHVASTVETDISTGGGGNRTAFSDSFTYSNGDLTGNAAWAAIAFYDSWVVSSNDVITKPSSSSFSDWANQNDTAMSSISIDTVDYTVEMVVHVLGTDLPLFEIFPEGDNAGDPTSAGNYKVDFQWGTPGTGYVSVVDQYSSATTGMIDLPQDADVTLTIVVTGRSVSAKVNGVTIATSAISSTNNAFKRFAFRAGGVGIINDGAIKAKSVNITTGAFNGWDDSFNYSNGNLSGNGGWVDNGGIDWVVANTSEIIPKTSGFKISDNLNFSDVAGFDPALDWNLSVVVVIDSTITGASPNHQFILNLGDSNDGSQGNLLTVSETSSGICSFTLSANPDGSTTAVTGIAVSRDTEHTIAMDYRASDTTIVATVDGVAVGSRIPITTVATITSAFLQLQGQGVRIREINLNEVSGSPQLNRTKQILVAANNNDTYTGQPDDMAVVSNSGSFQLDGTSPFVSAATLFGFTYIVDGTNIRKLDHSTNQFVSFTASAGSLPTGCTIAVNWRGRLVLSGSQDDPQNVFASKLGDPTDWDTGVDPPTPEMSWAANDSKSGLVGAPIIALIPLSDDILMMLCESSVWAMHGDITDGGSIDNISEEAGIISATAWCRGPSGEVYFVGPNGLYRTTPNGSSPTEISRDNFRKYFQGLNRSTNHVTLVYDKQRYGVWVFVAPEAEADAPALSLFYDVRLEGYWPIEFTNLPNVGPMSAIYWDGFEDSTRYPLLGSYDGFLYDMNFTNRFDADDIDNQAIPAYVVMGPISLSGVDDAILTRIDITAGELKTGDDASDWNLNMDVNGGQSAYDVTEGTPHVTLSENFTVDGRQMTRIMRVRGGFFSVKFRNGDSLASAGDYFTLENVTATVIPAGNQRVNTDA